MGRFTRLRGIVKRRAMNGETWEQRLKRRRQELGLRQAQLAEALDVSQSTITHWENGRREPENLQQWERLAAALKLHPAELIYGIEILPESALRVGREWYDLPNGVKEAIATTIHNLPHKS